MAYGSEVAIGIVLDGFLFAAGGFCYGGLERLEDGR
jgi:hypothetical protein